MASGEHIAPNDQQSGNPDRPSEYQISSDVAFVNRAVNPQERDAWAFYRGGELMDGELTHAETVLFLALVRHPGVPRKALDIYKSIFPGLGEDYDDRLMADKYIIPGISKLRKKLLEIDPSLDVIQTIRGQGFVFEPGM